MLNLVILLGLAYRIGVVEQCCQIVQYCTIFVKWCNFSTSCVGKISCHTIEKLVLHMLCLVSAFYYLEVHDDIDVDALITEIKPLKNISSSFVPDTFETRVMSAKLLPLLWGVGIERNFFQGWGVLADFFTANHKIFQGWPKVMKFIIFFCKLRKQPFLLKT